jgi:hypothetical protein
VVRSPQRVAATCAVTHNRLQGLRGSWGWTGCRSGPRHYLHSAGIPIVSAWLAFSFSRVCYPSFFNLLWPS